MEAGPGEAAPGEQGGAPGAGKRLAPLYKRLPRGPHQLGRRAVAQHQRTRIQGAMVQAVAASGYDAVSVRQVIALAGVSRRSFYEQFGSKQACFLATFDAIVHRHLGVSGRACTQAAGGPEAQLAAALAGYAGSIAADPEAAALALIEAPALGAPGTRRMRVAAAACEAAMGAALAGSRVIPALRGASVPGLLGGLHGITAAALRGPEPPAREMLEARLGWWMLAPRVPADSGAARNLGMLLREGSRRSAPRRGADGSDITPRGDRERLLVAALRLTAREPVPLLSAAQIADEAGLPLEAFFELFEDREGCLRAALLDAGEQLLAIAGGADGGEPDALRETLVRLLSHLAANPLQARAITVLAPCAGERCRAYGRELERDLGAALVAGLPRRGALAGEALGGALWHLIRCHLVDRRIRRLPAAADELALLVIAPVLGPDAAAAALAAPRRIV
jgi:AcrR family transcriptional regulator